MKTINIDGLPEDVARALESMVHALRENFRREQQNKAQQNEQAIQLPIWPGTVIGRLSRDEIYDDVV